jgi:hypothetical protein
VRTSIPSHIHPRPGYAEFLQELGRDPARHHQLTPGLLYDPEVVFMIDYLAEKAKGNVRSLPAGGQFYCSMEVGWLSPAVVEQLMHKLSQWISLTA